MAESSAHEITGLLQAWSAGDEQALHKLIPLVYEELRRTARRYMFGERTGHTLQTTALVNEVYLRLVDLRRINWQNRAQFLAICAQTMRRVLTDFARARRYQKRLFVAERPSDLVALDDALNALASVDQRMSQVVELRFFGGLSVKETADVLQVSSDTVMRDWKLARVLLLRELGEGRANGA